MTLMLRNEVLENVRYIENDEMKVEPKENAQMRKFKETIK